jgi:nudix-type nucleoside diphosphatase (YffH/AdpP family)
MDIFVFGTLKSETLRTIVLGRELAPKDICTASIKGFCVYWAKEGPFPVMVPKEGSEAHGLVLKNLSDVDVERLNYYELGFDYVLSPTYVETNVGPAEASAYFCNNSDMATKKSWSYDDWLSDHSEVQYIAAKEFLDFFDTKYGDTAQAMYNKIFKRAEVYANEATNLSKVIENGPENSINIQVENIQREYLGFFALNQISLKYSQFDGDISELKNRVILMGSEASLILPYDPVLDKVLLVEQFRIGPFCRGDRAPWVFEPVAGIIEVGETPDEAAKREVFEEAGLEVTQLVKMGSGYPNPGEATSYFYNYIAIVDLSEYSPGIYGAKNEGEDIRTHVIDFNTVLNWSVSNKLRVLPLNTMVLWLALNKLKLPSK